MSTPLHDPYTNAPTPAKGINGIQLSTGSGRAVNAIPAGADLITDKPARVAKVIVTTAGSVPGAVNDSASLVGVAAGNLVFTIPNTVGVYDLDWPCAAGIVVTPGTGQVVGISYA